ncbi:MAG: UTP--glucose-1-phosphate uridylyltransferase [Planctomycetes bacterium]|nr:UTP--glucose-1-phosphate uridylyltransferase [Planctomycetota bacterium]MCB9903994.1 UTP--glucose-1-phosphate uridylyltransferase [Planctomycetota bacterium]
MTERLRTQRERAERAGQGHVFRFWDELTADQRAVLLDQLEAVDYDALLELARLFAATPEVASTFDPPALFPRERDAAHEARAEEARKAGAELLARGKVGYLLVAGGQASRLGYEGPKGCFPVGPVSGRSLFEVHARRLRAAALRHGTDGPWYVMTSPANDAQTREFFAEHGHFGLDPARVHFFSQAMLPALDTEGRVLMSSKHELFLAPNGHGGVLAAFAGSGLLAGARDEGIEQISYFQVDNPLVRPADPLFLGLHALADAGMSSKIVTKRDEHEKVGVLGLADGKLGCIEYSDLPDALRGARDEHGQLVFGAGNIAVHAMSLDFLDEVCGHGLKLPWHLARKSMTVVGEDGALTTREGGKFETFVFDALGLAANSVTLEVDRAEEFSPVKNSAGSDSPETARRDMCRLHAGWVAHAGLELPASTAGDAPLVEVDPLVAETLPEFLAARPKRTEPPSGGHLYE